MKNKTKLKFSKLELSVLITSGIILLFFAFSIAAGNYMVSYAIGRSGDGGNRTVALDVDEEAVLSMQSEKDRNIQMQKERTEKFWELEPEEIVSTISEDGIPLVAGYYEVPESHNYAIVIHGYRSNHYGMMNFSERYYSEGFQVLAPDLRGCGESGGKFVGMGWPDRKDILTWIQWILEKDPDAKIVLHGISMGGATVMMTSGEETPDAVTCFVEDCGYTSVWDIFSSELNLRFHLPEFPVLFSANIISSIRAGYSFHEASSVNQVAKCEKPMLFIHGTEDDFVPFPMLSKVTSVKPGTENEIIEVQNAGHGEAMNVLGDKYWEEVFSFIKPYMYE